LIGARRRHTIADDEGVGDIDRIAVAEDIGAGGARRRAITLFEPLTLTLILSPLPEALVAPRTLNYRWPRRW
jgi:hypothetical protein